MAKRGKNYTESLKLIDKEKYYEGREAVELAVKTSKSKIRRNC